MKIIEGFKKDLARMKAESGEADEDESFEEEEEEESQEEE